MDAMEQKQGRRRRRREEPEMMPDEEEELVEERGVTERKGRVTPGRRSHTEAARAHEGNFITRPLNRFVGYLGDVRAELEKVTWPTRQETFDLTRIVLATTVVSALVLGIISLLFNQVIVLGLEFPVILVVAIVIAVGALVWYIRSSNRHTSSY